MKKLLITIAVYPAEETARHPIFRTDLRGVLAEIKSRLYYD
jgi:hypothetical protein